MKFKGLVIFFVTTVGMAAMAGASLLAQDEKGEQPTPYKETPEAFIAKGDRNRSGGLYPGAIVFNGSGLQSVAAGEIFSIDVYLNDKAPSDTEVTLKTFRVDLSGVGSGQVQVIPIVEGSGADEKYWATQPPSPIKIRRGTSSTRVRARVLPNAKQPLPATPGPFKPVDFPDQVIFIAENGNGVHTQILRVRTP